MKVITLTQPWATLVAIGEKKIETRSWSTKYRGPLAIHAAKGLSGAGGLKAYKQICATEPFYSVLQRHGEEYVKTLRGLKEFVENPLMPMGFIIAVCDLYTVFPTNVDLIGITDKERAFGDYSPGRFAWILRNVRKLEKPVEVKGKLGLWEYELTL